MTFRTEGSKYQQTKDLDIKEIAKLVRADLAAAQKDGRITRDARLSVKIKRYSGGQDMTVTAKYPYPIRVSSEVTEAQREEGLSWPWLVRRVVVNKEACEAIMAEYNYDDSDAQSDYFNVNFYAHTSEEGTAEGEAVESSTQERFLASLGAA